MSRAIDIDGQQFGRLLVVRRAGANGRRATWLCRCECGTEVTVLGRCLRLGETRSCGCLKRDLAAESRTKHGHAVHGHRTREYKSWAQMLTRCRNPRATMFKHYGGRGIRVCDQWFVFENFLADMEPAPSDFSTIERIDNDGHYEPGNVRWATRKEQSYNRRNSKLEEHEPAQIAWLVSIGYRRADVARFFGISASYAKAIASHHTTTRSTVTVAP